MNFSVAGDVAVGGRQAAVTLQYVEFSNYVVVYVDHPLTSIYAKQLRNHRHPVIHDPD